MRKHDDADHEGGGGRVGEDADHEGGGGRIGDPAEGGDLGEAALAGIDLDAWAPPPPPAGALADAVIARMRQPAGAPALEPVEPGAPARVRGHRRARGGRRWPIALAAAVVGAAGAAVIVLAVGRGGSAGAPAVSHGEVEQVQQQVRELRARLDATEQALAARQEPRPGLDERPEPQPSPELPLAPLPSGAPQLTDPPGTQPRQIRTAERQQPANPPAKSPPSPPAKSPPSSPTKSPPSSPPKSPAKSPPSSPPSPSSPPPAKSPRTPPPPASCDADALLERGREYFANGQYAAAITALEASYACRPNPLTVEKAFIAACNLPSLAKAARNWRLMPEPQRQRAVPVCVRNGITEDDLDRAASPRQAPPNR